ncbi:MAG: carboxypeptidase-like regulatory domain-containing protein, partial [Anaerolineales bacterium]|nr:carboxypeptidase-like regulatory domain-containing protein [Anaerolineales bacterium]
MAKKSEHHVHHHLSKSLDTVLIIAAVLIAIAGAKFVLPGTTTNSDSISAAAITDTVQTIPTSCLDPDGYDIYNSNAVVETTSQLDGEMAIKESDESRNIGDRCEGSTLIEQLCSSRIPTTYTLFTGKRLFKHEATFKKYDCPVACTNGACLQGVRVILTDKASGEPIYNARVQFKRNREIKQQLKTDRQGEAIFDRKLNIQVQAIKVLHDDYFEYGQKYYLPEELESILEIKLTPKVHLTVLDQDGLAVDQATVTFSHDTSEFEKTALTGSDGTVVVPLEHSGPYTVTDSAPTALSQNPDGLHLTYAGVDRPVILTMDRFPQITFNVSNAEGRNLRNALIEIFDADNTKVLGSTNYEGQTSIYLQPG